MTTVTVARKTNTSNICPFVNIDITQKHAIKFQFNLGAVRFILKSDFQKLFSFVMSTKLEFQE